MTETVKNKALVERFGRYVNHRKEAGRSSGPSFLEEMAQKSEAPKKRGKTVDSEVARSSRRFQPPKLGVSKHITQVQAQRLSRYAPVIEQAAKKYGVPVELICGVILQESGGNARAVSHCGAKGLMQLMPGTAKRFGVTNSFDPVQNIHGGTQYLKFLLDRFKGRLDLALAGYNAGEGNVEKYGNKIPPFKETQGYVPNVLGYTQSMIDIFYAKANRIDLPQYARRA